MKTILGMNVYDVKEVSEMLGISVTTVHAYIKNKTLDARKFGGRWHISEESIRALTSGTNTDETNTPGSARQL